MPVYIQAKSENQGQLFHKSATEEVAGRNAFSAIGGDDFSLVKSFGFHIINHASNSMDHFNFTLDVTVPAYPPVISMAMNIVNNKDQIESLVIREIVRMGATGKGKITSEYKAEKGELIHVALDRPNLSGSKEDVSGAQGTVRLSFKFQKLTHDDKITNTLGVIHTDNA